MKFYVTMPDRVDYDVTPNVKANEKQNAELNMYEFTLSTVDKEFDLDYKKYNGLIPIHLKMDNGLYFEELPLYITYYHKQIVAYNPKRYKYVIQATSPLLALQRIVLPNRLITQPIDENAEKKTIYGEISKLIQVYAPSFFLDENLSLEEGMQKYCPEMQFTKSTLYEVLVALFQVAGLVPRMHTFNEISYAPINGNENNWNSSEIFIREESSNAVANYADMLDVDIENAISKTEDISTTWIAAKSEEATLTTDNFEWEVPTDIYELEAVELIGDGVTYAVIPKTGGPGESKTLDYPISIKYWIVPKAIYDTLKVSNSVQLLRGREWKRNYMYYDGNKISGGAYNEDTWFGGGLNPAIYNIIWLTLEYYESYSNNVVTNLTIDDVRKLVIRVQYKTENDNTRVKIIKNGVVTPFNGLITNQDNSYIDTANFGKQNQELINRMGNEETIGQAHFDYAIHSYSNSPQVGDRVDNNYIISEREVLMQEYSMLVNYKLAKEYVFETGFSGLNQVKRFTQIDKEGVLVRNDSFLYNFQLSLTDNNVEEYLINRIIDNYGANQYNGMCLHYFRARLDDATPTSMSILLESQNKHIANSMVCQMGFKHNYIAGNQIGLEDSNKIGFEKIKIPVMKPVKYTDENGEFKIARIAFGFAEEQRNQNNYEWISRYPEAWPMITTAPPSHDYLIYKDTREISTFTFQFRMINSDKAFVYDKFWEYTQLVTHKATTLKLYVLYNKDGEVGDMYDANSITPLGTVFEGATISIGLDPEGKPTKYIAIRNVLYDIGFHAIGITDSNDNLLFAVNYNNVSIRDTDVILYVNKI